MPKHVTKVFDSVAVPVDGEHFMDCEFRNCDLIYAGGELPRMDGSHFHDCRWLFDGPADRTMSYLRMMLGWEYDPLTENIARMLGAAIVTRKPEPQPDRPPIRR